MAENENFPLALPTGTVLAGQYTIERVLGQGGFGITYAAVDHSRNIKVAVKEFFPDTLAFRETSATVRSYPGERSENFEYGKESFLQEAKTLAEFIGCDNVVRIYSYFEENGTAYFVMEYIDGLSFDDYIAQHGGKVSIDDAKRILIPVMDALAVVHSRGIVHRDVTPDNIYITNSGEVKLLDFGAARYSLGDKSRSLDVILKHGFAPKEQYTRRGKQGPFTDVYSLGATFYFALTGRRPPDSIDRIEEDELIPPSSLGVKITEYEERAILQAMEVQPAARFQSMTAFKNVFINEKVAVGAAVVPSAAAQPVQQTFFNAPPQVQPPTASPVRQPVQQPVGQTAMQPPAQPVQQTEQQPVEQPIFRDPDRDAQQAEDPTAQQSVTQKVLDKVKKFTKKQIAIASAAGAALIVVIIIVVSVNSKPSGSSTHGLGGYTSTSDRTSSSTTSNYTSDPAPSYTPDNGSWSKLPGGLEWGDTADTFDAKIGKKSSQEGEDGGVRYIRFENVELNGCNSEYIRLCINNKDELTGCEYHFDNSFSDSYYNRVISDLKEEFGKPNNEDLTSAKWDVNEWWQITVVNESSNGMRIFFCNPDTFGKDNDTNSTTTQTNDLQSTDRCAPDFGVPIGTGLSAAMQTLGEMIEDTQTTTDGYYLYCRIYQLGHEVSVVYAFPADTQKLALIMYQPSDSDYDGWMASYVLKCVNTWGDTNATYDNCRAYKFNDGTALILPNSSNRYAMLVSADVLD